jgi:ribosomal protein S18 acetylase RimI-like enzyme
MLFVVPLQMWEQRVAYIYAVATQPEYRGRGIASNLLKEALQLVEQSCKFDCVALIPSSTESKRLYERLGFEDCQKPMLFPASDYLGTGSVPHDLAMIKLFK